MTSPDRPRLLVLSSTYPRWKGDHEPGFVHELCRRLAGAFEVIVLTSHAPGAQRREIMDGVEVIRYRYAPRGQQTLVYGGGMLSQLRRHPWKALWLPGFIYGQWRMARRLVRERGVALIHAHWIVPQGMVAHWIVRRARGNVGLAVTAHGSDVHRMKGWPWLAIKRRVARACSLMTVVSPALREEALGQGLRPRRIEVMPMGVDMHERFTPGPAVTRSQDELVFVGRLIPQKGLSTLISAMPAILAACPRARLTVAGDGPELASCRRRVQALGLEGAVQFLGAVPNEKLPGLYRRAAVCVTPFLQEEGLGMVVIEALACGCPVVASDIASLRAIAREAGGVTLVPPGDEARLAQAVVGQLRAPAGEDERLRLRERIMPLHDWESVARGYREALGSCLPAGRGAAG